MFALAHRGEGVIEGHCDVTDEQAARVRHFHAVGSATHEAMGAIRVMATCMAMGEAAGAGGSAPGTGVPGAAFAVRRGYRTGYRNLAILYQNV